MATQEFTPTVNTDPNVNLTELVELIAKALRAMPTELYSQAHDAAVCALEQQDKQALMAALEPGFIVIDHQRQFETD